MLEGAGIRVLAGRYGGEASDSSVAERELREEATEADGIILGTAQMTEGVIRGLPRLRVIARRGVGFDNVDVTAANEAGIVVSITRGAIEATVAEHTLALILCMAHHVVGGNAAIHRGEWPRMEGRLLAGATLGVVGFGAVGQRVGRLARSLGMKVIVSEQFPALVRGYPRVELAELLTEADVVSVHVPGGDANRALIDDAALRRMRPGSLLVNTARGGVVDEEALAAALREGRIGGAALDVLATEPPRSAALIDVPNLVMTPHIAGYSREASVAANVMAAESVVRVLAGRRLPRRWIIGSRQVARRRQSEVVEA